MENGSKQKMAYKLPVSIVANTPIFAQCYSEEDGAYLISGIVDSNGYANFNDYILRKAANVTVFTLK